MNDANFSACKNSSDIVPYMYAELSSSDSSVFESHLLDCGECTDQFAEISNARFEVYEWKKLEFDPLVTPGIRIPYESESAVGVSWIDKVRAAFGHGWKTPGLAFAGMAIVSTLAAVLVLTRDDGSDIAANINSNVPAVNTAGIQASDPPTLVLDRPVDTVKGLEVQQPVQIESTTKPLEPKRTNQGRRAVRPQNIDTIPASARNQQRSVPTLNEFSEDEDTSLRLAELFEDIETSD